MRRKQKIKLLLGAIALVLLIIVAVYFAVRPKAETLTASNTALGYYTENGINKSVQSNTVITDIVNPSPSPSLTITPSPSPISSSLPISPNPSLTPTPSPSPTTFPQLLVVQTPSNPNRFFKVSITATVSNDPSHLASSIQIYLDNKLVKTCTTSPCVYSKRLGWGTHTYYATTTGYVLRAPTTGTYSFYVNKW